jgi:deoxyxylulose-5-phosphate synthase
VIRASAFFWQESQKLLNVISRLSGHLGGALGAALLKLALKRKWVIQDLDSRAL